MDFPESLPLIYKRLPLSIALSSIRLITLEPGQWDVPLQASIEVVHLTDRPVYHTLSYVWGDQAADSYAHFIRIDETNIPISKDLFDAIRGVRLHVRGESLKIWVDALCINQLDITERSQQVQIMGQIYSQCQEVHICIVVGSIWPSKEAVLFTGNDLDYGDLWDEYTKHFSFLSDARDIASISSSTDHYRPHIFFAWIFRALSSGGHLTEVPAFLPVLQSNTIWAKKMKHSILDVSLRPWFGRLWVVQEAALAPAGHVYIGPVSLPLKVMIDGAVNYQLHTNNKCCNTTGLNRDAIDQNISAVCNHFCSLDLIQRSPPRVQTLIEISLTFMNREATDTHDLVYSLLGLARSKIVPNYETDIRTLFMDVSKEHIVLTANLLPLSFGNISSTIPDLPTWVMDLERPLGKWRLMPQIRDWFRQRSNFSACGGLALDKVPMIRDEQLHLLGIQFDQIVATSTIIDAPQGGIFGLSHYNVISDATRLPAQMFQTNVDFSKSPSDIYPGGGSWRNAWWRTLLHDHCWALNLNERASDKHVATLSFLANFPKGVQEWEPDEISQHLEKMSGVEETLLTGTDSVFDELMIKTIHEHFCWQTEDRRMFTTKKGYLGTATKEILEQDWVFILPGSPVPIVLRPTPAPPKDGPLLYLNVGDCYLHGIMDGEVANEDDKNLQHLVIV